MGLDRGHHDDCCPCNSLRLRIPLPDAALVPPQSRMAPMTYEVKRMPYPYRAILDAGVCAGLSWGMGFGLKKFDASKADFEPILMDFPRCHSLHLCQVSYHWKGTRY